MRKLLIIIIIYSLSSCSQKPTRHFTFNEIGWTIELPDGFEVLDSANSAARMEKSKKTVEASTDDKIVALNTRHLIVAKKNVSNYFICSLTPYIELTPGSWQSSIQKIRDLSFELLVKKFPSAQFDTLTSSITIDSLSFSKFLTAGKEDGKLLYHSVMLSKLYKIYDLKISYVCDDFSIEKEIEEMLRNSKFSNE